jgi:diguanylate cyclase (GGDEF)-like protein
LDQSVELLEHPQWLRSVPQLPLLRMRLRLALITMALVPVLLVFSLAGGSLAAVVNGAPLPVEPLALVVGLSAFLIAVAMWMSRQVLRPAEQLARSHADLAALYETVKGNSLRDPLTGLGNHRAFQEEVDRQLEWYRRYKVPFALLVFDLDNFKSVNEAEGHAAGDELLREMGRLIAQVTRYADRSFRIGGDNFALLMPHTDAAGANDLGRRLLERALQPRAGGRPMAFSGGISVCPASATTRSQLLAQAEAALHWCKRHGRSLIDVFDPVRDREANQLATGEVAATISRVIHDGMLGTAYQPIVDLTTGVVVAFEGLTRPFRESGFADPSSLFAAADSVGRSVELDLACIETLVRNAVGLGPQQLLSVNVTPRFLEVRNFNLEWLLAVLRRYSLEPSRVIIELTERETVDDIGSIQGNLAALQRAGIRVAADDVGAGNSGLRLLSQVRFDIVKLDLVLVQDGTRHEASRAVLRSLRDLASRWGAYMIAEGVETVGQLHAVREIGVVAGQGYLLSRPMPEPRLASVDVRLIEAGGAVMSVRPAGIGTDFVVAS